MNICQTFCRFKEEYPLYFEILAANIEVSEGAMEKQPVLREIYQTGEEINTLRGNCILEMLPGTDARAAMQIVFMQRGSLYGMITMADNKEEYIQKNEVYQGRIFTNMLYHAFQDSFTGKEEGRRLKKSVYMW